MEARGYERAVSVQIGAVLILAILVGALALWQVNVVPVENGDVEIDHHAEVGSQLLDVRNGIVSATGGSRGFSQTVSLGTTYPQRSFLVNPPDPTGTLRTVGTTNDSIAVGIENASATDDDVRDVWNGTERAFGTGALVYEPNYNEFRSAPVTVYENSVLYDQYETGATSERTGQRLVDGNRISIVTVDGRYDRTARSAAIDVETVSSSTNEVSIRNDTENVTITVPSRRSATDWHALLRDEEQLTNQSGHVVGVEPAGTATVDDVTYNLVEIRLEPGVTYDLAMAKVGIGAGVESESSAYLTGQDGDGATIATDEDHELVVEVRDGYNNPVSDVTVNASADAWDDRHQSETGGDGRATFVYNSSAERSDTIEVTFSTSPGDAQTVEFSITVSDGGSDESGGSYDVYWDTTEIDSQPGISCTDGNCTYNLGADSAELTVGTSPSVGGASVDYSLEGSGASISPSAGETDSSGQNATTLFDAGAGDGDRVAVHANSGGDGEALLVSFESAQFFDVTIDGTSGPVNRGDNLTVDVTVENTGSEAGTQDVEFDFDGVTEDAETVTLSSGGTASLTFEYNTSGETEGDHDVTVSSDDTVATETVTITGDEPYFTVSDFRAPSSAGPGETIAVNATVENTGGSAGTRTVEYRFDGTTELTRDVSLNASERTTVEFDYTISSARAAGDYGHGIYSDNDSDAGTITVEVAPEIDRFDVVDRSKCDGPGGSCRDSNEAIYDVDWSVSDENGNLDTVTVELVDSDGNVVDSDGKSVSGDSTAATSTVRDQGGYGDDYTIRLVVTDTAGNSDATSVTDTAEGTDP